MEANRKSRDKPSHDDVQLRNVIPQEDLPVFFENQCDPEVNYMAAFTARDPSDRAGFLSFWDRILSEPKNSDPDNPVSR